MLDLKHVKLDLTHTQLDLDNMNLDLTHVRFLSKMTNTCNMFKLKIDSKSEAFGFCLKSLSLTVELWYACDSW